MYEGAFEPGVHYITEILCKDKIKHIERLVKLDTSILIIHKCWSCFVLLVGSCDSHARFIDVVIYYFCLFFKSWYVDLGGFR